MLGGWNKKFFVSLASLFLCLGLVGLILKHKQNYLLDFMEDPEIKKQIGEKEAGIFIIYRFCTSCTSLSDFYRNQSIDNRKIILIVNKDFSDIDIINFREAYSISLQDPIFRMNDQWKDGFVKSGPLGDQTKNHFLLINKGELEKTWNF